MHLNADRIIGHAVSTLKLSPTSDFARGSGIWLEDAMPLAYFQDPTSSIRPFQLSICESSASVSRNGDGKVMAGMGNGRGGARDTLTYSMQNVPGSLEACF